MGKVYITKANTNLILRGLKQIQDKVSNDVVLSELKNDFVELGKLANGGFETYFNIRELKAIYKMKMIFKDLPQLIEDMKFNKNAIAKRIESENRRFVNKVKAPAYHATKECKALNSDFSNIEIPASIDDEIRNKIKIFIEPYRYSKSIAEINLLCRQEFGITEELTEINLANSGVESFDNLAITSKIEKEFASLENMLYSGAGNSENKNIKAIKYAEFWKVDAICANDKYSNDERHEIKKFMQTKKDLTTSLFAFYRGKYNQDLSFEGSVLDSIGFRPCRQCAMQNAVPLAA